MTFYIHTDSALEHSPKRSWAQYARKLAIAGTATLLLAGCGDKGETKVSPASSGATASEYEVDGDHAIGNPEAKATVVEYASVVCAACANWHTSVYPDFKKTYIDSGKVRFIFREFPTSPENLAQAGFLLANCANEDKFFENISLQFKRQNQIFEAARNGKVLEEYHALAKAAGMSVPEFEACLANEEEIAKYKAVVQGGIDAGVTSTPTFFINGVKEKVFKMEDFAEKLAPILGEPLPVKDEAEE